VGRRRNLERVQAIASTLPRHLDYGFGLFGGLKLPAMRAKEDRLHPPCDAPTFIAMAA
jgi:hypothetical protein